MKKILFTSLPAYGHVFPMLPLASAARAAGHEVAFATGPDLAGPLKQRGFQVWPAGPSLADSWAVFHARYTKAELAALPPTEARAAAIAVVLGESSAQRAVDIVPHARAWQPDVIVRDPCEFAGAAAAMLCSGVRDVVHATTALSPPSVREPFAAAANQVGSAWGIADLGERMFGAAYLDICPPALQPEGNRSWPQATPLRPHPIGVGPGEGLPSADGFDWSGTVYLTLGTFFNKAPAVRAAALAGLSELDVNVVVTIGPDADPSELAPLPSNVLVARFIPQELVLPGSRLVVSHGGSGTMLGAFGHGLPQLMLPQGADNFLNAEAAQRAGAALSLPPGEVSAAAIAAAASRLLTEPEFTAAAQRVQTEIATMPTAAEVLAGIASDS
ncbi:glycosyltransferase [Flindersiella endophytica]